MRSAIDRVIGLVIYSKLSAMKPDFVMQTHVFHISRLYINLFIFPG